MNRSYIERVHTELVRLRLKHGIYMQGGEDRGWKCDRQLRPVVVHRINKLQKILAMGVGCANCPTFVFDDISRPTFGYSYRVLERFMSQTEKW